MRYAANGVGDEVISSIESLFLKRMGFLLFNDSRAANHECFKMSTLRKKIAEALERESLDLREISKLFGIKEKEVLDHLTHIEKLVHHRAFTVEPASCQQCGFSFKKRTRLSTPSRCPACKSEHISPPRFKINNA